jgi:hypothetical protein
MLRYVAFVALAACSTASTDQTSDAGDASAHGDDGSTQDASDANGDASGMGDASVPDGSSSDGSSVRPLAFGVFVSDPMVGGNAPWTPAAIDGFTMLVGAKPTAWHWYEPFQTGFTQANFDAVTSRGFTPILSWAPSDATGAAISDAAVASGTVDGLLHAFATKAAAWGKPFYLRLGWEMNLSSIGGWGVGANGNTGADYIAMWKHVHDLVVQDGATAIRWFWCPSEIGANDPPLSNVYPGDAYVDFVGFDAYNWGTTQSWSNWRSLVDTYKATYAAVAALTSKPMIVGETGSAEQGGDKGMWMTQGFLTDLPAQFPRIIGVVYFDENAPPDWRVETSPGSLAAFKEVIGAARYQGTLP